MKISENVFALQEMIFQIKNNFVLIFEQMNLSTLTYRKFFCEAFKGFMGETCEEICDNGRWGTNCELRRV